MKKTARVFIAGMLVVLMLFSLTACQGATDILKGLKGGKSLDESDYQEMIDEFVSDPLNTFELTVGEEHGPGARVWLKSGGGTTYSSDESVVTVTDGGKVTAVGAGTAYVVITGKSDLYEVYRYDVYDVAKEADLSNLPQIDGIDFATEIANFNSTQMNTYELKVGEKHTPGAAIWAQSGGKCYTSDESVVTVNSSGNVTAQGKGTAYVIIKSSLGTMFDIYKYVVKA